MSEEEYDKTIPSRVRLLSAKRGGPVILVCTKCGAEESAENWIVPVPYTHVCKQCSEASE